MLRLQPRQPLAIRAVRRQERRLACLAVASGLLIGCGNPSAPTGEATTPAAPPILDFSSIAGNWGGTVTETVLNFVIQYEAFLGLETSAQMGRKVGTIDYGSGEDACGGDVLASKAEGNDYALEESLTYGLENCRNGIIRLRHDEIAGSLNYEWLTRAGELHATAVLTRP